MELRNPDKTGNLFETVDRIDRKYSAGGRLEQSIDWNYKYDAEGRLIEKRHRVQVQQAWKYHWNSAGMLEEVVRPDGSTVSFKYDALGRRIEKQLFNRKTRWVWDGNVPLHEWNEVYTKDYTEEKGEFYTMKPSNTTTWLFEEGTFVPNGKLVGEENFSIQSNYLGTPEVMYDADGKVVWSAELDAYGDVRELTGERTNCPFRYQGQYEDKETGLYYNRFRYYSPEEAMYISQDPIGIKGGFNLYKYVKNTNISIDILGKKDEPWHPHTATENDIISKGVHFNAGDKYATELKLKLDEKGDIAFEGAFNASSSADNKRLQNAIKLANEKFKTDKNWRLKLLKSAGDVKNSLFDNFNRLDRVNDVKK